MTKLTDILAEILFEKKLCPKGRAYYNHRKAAGEKSSAYLSGRAVKVCKGLMEEDDLNEINFKTLALTALLGLSSVSNTQAKSSPNTTQTIVSPSTTQNNSNLLDKAINKLKKEGYNLDIGVSIDVKKSFLKDIPLDNIKVEFFNANTNAASQLVASEFIRVNKLKPHQTILFHNNEKHALIYVKDNVNESLRDWFKKEDWVRIDTAGNITGPCGTMKKGNATTRCLPRAKANSLTKAERAATSKKKAASDKQFVPNTKKAKVSLNEIEDPTIECGRCGWRWKVSQSDPSDLYICHKCNFDNSYKYNNDLDEYDVENEQDVKEFVQFMREYQQQLSEADCDCLLEAKYQGRTVPLGKPMQGDSKKFKVYVKNPKTGKVVKVNFGFGGTSAKGKRMSIKKNNPVRRKAFRARHNCDNPGPRTKARYWSCRKW